MRPPARIARTTTALLMAALVLSSGTPDRAAAPERSDSQRLLKEMSELLAALPGLKTQGYLTAALGLNAFHEPGRPADAAVLEKVARDEEVRSLAVQLGALNETADVALRYLESIDERSHATTVRDTTKSVCAQVADGRKRLATIKQQLKDLESLRQKAESILRATPQLQHMADMLQGFWIQADIEQTATSKDSSLDSTSRRSITEQANYWRGGGSRSTRADSRAQTLLGDGWARWNEFIKVAKSKASKLETVLELQQAAHDRLFSSVEAKCANTPDDQAAEAGQRGHGVQADARNGSDDASAESSAFVEAVWKACRQSPDITRCVDRSLATHAARVETGHVHLGCSGAMKRVEEESASIAELQRQLQDLDRNETSSGPREGRWVLEARLRDSRGYLAEARREVAQWCDANGTGAALAAQGSGGGEGAGERTKKAIDAAGRLVKNLDDLHVPVPSIVKNVIAGAEEGKKVGESAEQAAQRLAESNKQIEAQCGLQDDPGNDDAYTCLAAHEGTDGTLGYRGRVKAVLDPQNPDSAVSIYWKDKTRSGWACVWDEIHNGHPNGLYRKCFTDPGSPYYIPRK